MRDACIRSRVQDPHVREGTHDEGADEDERASAERDDESRRGCVVPDLRRVGRGGVGGPPVVHVDPLRSLKERER